MTFRGDRRWSGFSGHVCGLIFFRRNLHYEEEYVICNPSTGKFGSLPLPKGRRAFDDKPRSFLGFDPIDKQFKLLSIRHRSFDENQILTLGTGKDSWRKIQIPLSHYSRGTDAHLLSDCICINGVLYYFAVQTERSPLMIVCFDVRSEKFKFIQREFLSYWNSDWNDIKLINYKGTLGVVIRVRRYHRDDSMRLRLWIMKDVKNLESEWSEYVCNFKKEDVDDKKEDLGGNVFTGWKYHFNFCNFFIVGVTATGDIVLSMNYTSRYEPFYVCYINPKTNTLQIVEIHGLGGPIGQNNVVRVFIDYVEDLKFINMPRQLESQVTEA